MEPASTSDVYCSIDAYRQAAFAPCFLELQTYDNFHALLHEAPRIGKICWCSTSKHYLCSHVRRWYDEHERMVRDTYPLVDQHLAFPQWFKYCYVMSANCKCC